MLAEPQPTAYDLNFRLGPFPVRINPFFWVGALLLGGIGTDTKRLIAWVIVVFVSILWHELGHAVTARVCGAWPRIVMHGLGGLCIYDSHRTNTLERIAIVFCGPAAGLVLGGLAALVGYAVYQVNPVDTVLAVVGLKDALALKIAFVDHPMAEFIYLQMIWVNLCWSLVNLLPLWPLDGGQLTELSLEAARVRGARRYAHIVSIITASIVAGIALLAKDYYIAAMMGVLAFVNYQSLSALHASRSADPSDWWKR